MLRCIFRKGSSPSQPTSKQTTSNASSSLIHTVPKDHPHFMDRKEADLYSGSALLRWMEPKRYENEWKMEITPEKMTISEDAPLQVTLKCLAEKKQEVAVEMDSFLYVLLNPRAARGTKSQIYHVMKKGETLIFQIGMMEKTPPGAHESDLPYMEKPEGKLTILHTNCELPDDSDASWAKKPTIRARFGIVDDSGIIDVIVNDLIPHGHFEQEVGVEEETELTKKRREQFAWILKKENMRKEREKKRKEEEWKKKNKKCCIIL